MTEPELQDMGRKSRECFDAQFARAKLLQRLQDWMEELVLRGER